MRRLVTFACLASAVSCGGKQEHPETHGAAAVNASLGGVVVANVGGVAIDRSVVLSIARARAISAKDALSAAIDEALYAEAANRAHAFDDASLRAKLDGILGRALAAKVRAQVLAEGPFTDAEIAAAAVRHPELSRPEARVTVHALIKKDVPNAEALAKDLRAQLVTANGADAKASAAAFRAKAGEFPMPAGKSVIVEDLPPIDAEGHVMTDASSVEQSFAKGTFAVPNALGTSEVTPTSYGFHVIRVLEVLPAYEASRNEKLEKMEPDLIAARAKKVWDPLLERLRDEAKPQVTAVDGDLLAPHVQ